MSIANTPTEILSKASYNTITCQIEEFVFSDQSSATKLSQLCPELVVVVVVGESLVYR